MLIIALVTAYLSKSEHLSAAQGFSDSLDSALGKGHFDSVGTKNVSPSAQKLLRLKELEYNLRDSLPAPSDRYWEPDQGAKLARYLSARLVADQMIREHLVSEFGERAREMPEFKSAFFPLNMQHSYLSSQDQIRLQEFQIESQLALLGRQDSELPAGSAATGLNSRPSLRGGPKTIFGPVALREYKLRNSPLAQKIAKADLDFTEREFREVYDTLEAFMPGPGQPPIRPDKIRSELEKRIEPFQALKVMAALDSNFDKIEQAGLEQGLTEDEIYQVFQIFADADSRMLTAYGLRYRDVEGSNRKILLAIEQRRDQLARLVGQAKADVLIEARQ